MGKIQRVSNTHQCFLPSIAVKSSKSLTAYEVGVKKIALLKQEIKPNKTKVLCAVKIALAPLTLVIYALRALCVFLASMVGIGTKKDLKKIDLQKRQNLLGLGGEVVHFGFNKKAVLEGMYFPTGPSNKDAKTILLCTGSHRSYEHYAKPMVEALLSMGHNVFVFNYEGFGKSQGSATEAGVYRSAEAAYQYLKQVKGCKEDKIVGWGYSLGSGAIAKLSETHTIDIVLDRGFSSMSQVAFEKASCGLKTLARCIFIAGCHFNTIKMLKKAKGKIFVAQGINDQTMVKDYHGKALQKALSAQPHFTYKEVNSSHHHTDWVWFGEDEEERKLIEQFVSQ